jgi:Fibrinogen beta and gamma chains, C-terminal globular domain
VSTPSSVSGNEKIFLLTNNTRTYSLWIQMTDSDSNSNYAQYSNFKIGSAADKYRLISLGDYMAPDNAAGTLIQH